MIVCVFVCVVLSMDGCDYFRNHSWFLLGLVLLENQAGCRATHGHVNADGRLPIDLLLPATVYHREELTAKSDHEVR